MMDSCSYYHHLQAPSVKYMKPEPVTYYHYADDADRYQSSIAAVVSGHSQVHSTFTSSGGTASLTNYTPSHYANYSTPTPGATAVYHSQLSTESSNGFNMTSHHVATPSQLAQANDPQAVSPAQSSRVAEEAASITAPLTPPLSVSPAAAGAESPAPHSMASLPHTSGYQDTDGNAYQHHSATASPQQADCDSTTHSDHFLSEGEIIPPLHVLSDLSEGLPLPGESSNTCKVDAILYNVFRVFRIRAFLQLHASHLYHSNCSITRCVGSTLGNSLKSL